MSDPADRLRQALSGEVTREQSDTPDAEWFSSGSAVIKVAPVTREVFVQVATSGPPAALVALEILDNHDNVVVQVMANGSVAYGDGYDPDDAARTFWAAMAAHFSRNIRLNQK